MKILLFVFQKKKLFGSINLLGHFLPFDSLWSKLSQATVTVGSLNSQDMVSQVNGYVIDTVWIFCDVYVWRSIFNRGSYGFVKKLP